MIAKLALLFLSLAALVSVVSASALTEEQYQHAFVQFIGRYNKKYTVDTFFRRYNAFKDTLDFIEQYNNGNSTSTVGLNEFSDLTDAEFAASHGCTGLDPSYPFVGSDIPVDQPEANPATIDWRSKSAVTSVKNQGTCGSCWSFSSAGSIEGAWAIKGKGLNSLSEQQLVDCSTTTGCISGNPASALSYVISNKGITGDKDYPYVAKSGTCAAAGKPIRATISKTNYVSSNSDSALETAVAMGPVSVAVASSQKPFRGYTGGIVSDPTCGTAIDHAVLIVGYNTNGNVKYWIVKNSWGTAWGGQGGYIYIARAAGNGICGINMQPVYPGV